MAEDFMAKVNKYKQLMNEGKEIIIEATTSKVDGKNIALQNDAESIFDPEVAVGIPTYIKSLDNLIGGLKMTTTTLLTADTGMGKSLLAIKMLSNLAKEGHKVCYFDLENGRTTSIRRIYGIWHEVNVDWFKNPANKTEFQEKVKEITNLVYYDHDQLYKAGLDGEGYKLVIDLMEKHVEQGYKVFLIDPLQAFIPEGSTDNTGLRVMATAIKKFKEFAQSKKVAIIVCHHLRKSTSGGGNWVEEIEDAKKTFYKNPTLDDIKGLSELTQTATDVWGLVRTKQADTKEKQGSTLLSIMKNRNGPEGFVELWLDINTLVFLDPLDMDHVDAFNQTSFVPR